MKFPTESELKRTVTIRTAFFKLTKDINAALFLSQLHYWTKKTTDINGWIYKTQKELETEIFLTPYQQRRARKLLLSRNLIEEKCIGLPKVLHFRINQFGNQIITAHESNEQEMKKMHKYIQRNKTNNVLKPAANSEETLPINVNKIESIDEETLLNTYIEEITTKNTAENTTEMIYTPDKGMSLGGGARDVVQTVFDHWKVVMNHPSAKLDGNRSKLIKEALKLGYTMNDLYLAISGCAVTPHNIGENDRGQRYDGLHIILKNADQIDRFINNYKNPPKLKTKSDQLIQNNIGVAERWLSTESGGKANGFKP